VLQRFAHTHARTSRNRRTHQTRTSHIWHPLVGDATTQPVAAAGKTELVAASFSAPGLAASRLKPINLSRARVDGARRCRRHEGVVARPARRCAVAAVIESSPDRRRDTCERYDHARRRGEPCRDDELAQHVDEVTACGRELAMCVAGLDVNRCGSSRHGAQVAGVAPALSGC
jgi:hypothetical protein